jgi:hypothetical protein
MINWYNINCTKNRDGLLKKIIIKKILKDYRENYWHKCEIIFFIIKEKISPRKNSVIY